MPKISDLPSVNSVADADQVAFDRVVVGGYETVRASASLVSPVRSVAGKTGAVVLAIADISGLTAALAAAGPVKSVAGKVGTVTLAIADVVGLIAALATAGPIVSVNAKVGTVVLNAGDINTSDGGAGAINRATQTRLRLGPVLDGDYTTTSQLAAAAMGRAVVEYAFRRRFMGPDQTEQFRIEGTPLAVEYWRSGGATAGAGPFLYAWSETEDDVDASIGAKGAGGVYFSNGAGPMLTLGYSAVGKETDATVTINGGAQDYSSHPSMSVPDNRQIWLGVNNKSVLRINADTVGSGDTMYVRIASDTTMAKILAEGSAASVPLYIQSKGAAGQITFGTSLGNLALMLPPVSGSPVNYILTRAGNTGVSAEVGVYPINDMPLKISNGGTTDLAGAVMQSGEMLRTDGTGFTVDNVSSVVIFHSASPPIASVTVAMPASPRNGRIVWFLFNVVVTSFTLTGVSGSPTAAVAGDHFAYRYSSSLTKWMRFA